MQVQCAHKVQADDHGEGEEGVGDSDFAVVGGGQFTEEGAAWNSEHVVGDVKDSESEDEDGDDAWASELQ